MFEHRQKRIGKSTYTIIKTSDGFRIFEKYVGLHGAIGVYSPTMWDNVEDVIIELRLIDREQYYTDKSGGNL